MMERAHEYRAEDWVAALGARRELGDGACMGFVRRGDAWMIRVFESMSEFDARENQKELIKEPVVSMPRPMHAMETSVREREAVDEVFGLLGSLTDTETVVRMTNTTPLLISVLDVIQSVKGGSSNRANTTWKNLKNAYPEVEGKITYHRFPGSRGRKTTVADINNIMYIMFRLPGDIARKFAERSYINLGVCNGPVIELTDKEMDVVDISSQIYGCSACNYVFDTADQLSSHRRTHAPAKELPGACAVCGMRFAGKAQLHHHRERLHQSGTVALCSQNKENAIVAAVMEVFSTLPWERQQFIGWGCWSAEPRQSTRAFLDLYGQQTLAGSVLGQVILEVDENCHRGYGCDAERMINVCGSMVAADNPLPTIWFRYNPDRFTVNSSVARHAASDRLETLLAVMGGMRFGEGCPRIRVVYLYYNSVVCSAKQAKAAGRIDLAGQLVPEVLLGGDPASNVVLSWLAMTIV